MNEASVLPSGADLHQENMFVKRVASQWRYEREESGGRRAGERSIQSDRAKRESETRGREAEKGDKRLCKRVLRCEENTVRICLHAWITYVTSFSFT